MTHPPSQEQEMNRTDLTKRTARYKGMAAFGSLSATVLLCFLTPYFLVLGVPMTVWLTYRWLRYRAEWGMRF